MNDSTRTITFVGVAAALAATAFGMHFATQPAPLDEYSDVGDEYYPDFKSPSDATGLRVAAYNEDAARVDVFSVEQKDGLWTIPSHHNYPADGEDQLAKTATSIIGLEREALVSTSADDHKTLGVLDPLDEEVTGTEGRGDRITLSKGDQTLADYIIGTKIEDGPENTFHVRRADEDRTYRVTLDIDISTKFADWIEPDLLDFRRGDIRELVVDRYSVDETRGALLEGEKSQLSRASQNDDWQLTAMADDQKVKVSTVNTMINALEDLAIVGVRPKPKGLSADLKRGSIIAEDGTVSMTSLRDLQSRGFFLLPDGSIKSNEGEVTLALSDGVKYVLGFGEVFTGSDVEIEVGQSSASGDDATDEEDTKEESSEEDAAEDGDSDETTEDDSLKKSRYLFILTQFDESYLEPLPEKPVKPEPPKQEETAEGENAEQPKDDGDGTTSENAESETKEDDGTETADEEPKEDSSDADAEYEQALAKYEADLKNWERQQEDREQKIEDGNERVGELNARFAGWYYVISADKFDDIRVAPEDLVEAADPPEETEADTLGQPVTETPAPEMKEDADGTQDENATPASETPDAAEKPAEPKADSSEADKPVDGTKKEADTPKNDEDPKPESSKDSSAKEETDDPPATENETDSQPEGESSEDQSSGSKDTDSE